MSEDRELIKKRFAELYRKSEGGYFTFTDFLSLDEQAALKDTFGAYSYAYTLYGGSPHCERVMARFGSPDELGYEEPFPISVLKISPRAPKFAEKLSHRDYLGTILGLGLERSVIGDIAPYDGGAYVFVREDIAEYIKENLTRVRHTEVIAEISDSAPEGELWKTERLTVQLCGVRADALISKVFHISRDESAALFKRGLVFISGRECSSPSAAPKVGDIISCRGLGRFIYSGESGLSKKGKINALVDKYV